MRRIAPTDEAGITYGSDYPITQRSIDTTQKVAPTPQLVLCRVYDYDRDRNNHRRTQFLADDRDFWRRGTLLWDPRTHSS